MLIESTEIALHPLGGLINDIRALKDRDWICSFSHILREGNFSANALAKSGCDMELDFEVLWSPPSFLTSFLQADKWGVKFPVDFSLILFIFSFVTKKKKTNCQNKYIYSCKKFLKQIANDSDLSSPMIAGI
ncbi:hypothetical protein REPUB_Repub13aG0147600 [Reevesia pubescens]